MFVLVRSRIIYMRIRSRIIFVMEPEPNYDEVLEPNYYEDPEPNYYFCINNNNSLIFLFLGFGAEFLGGSGAEFLGGIRAEFLFLRIRSRIIIRFWS